MVKLDCLPQNVSISANICVFCEYYYSALCKRCPTSDSRPTLKMTYFPIHNQDPSKIVEHFSTETSFDNINYKKNVTRLLDSLNNKYGTFVRVDQTKCQSLHKIVDFQNVITYFIYF